jgi:hypothetical protein
LINHNLYGVENFSIFIFYFFWGDFFEKSSILEVEIGRNGPRILGAREEEGSTDSKPQ